MWRKIDQFLWFYVWDNLHVALTWLCWSLARAVMVIPQLLWSLRGWDTRIGFYGGNLFDKKQDVAKKQ